MRKRSDSAAQGGCALRSWCGRVALRIRMGPGRLGPGAVLSRVPVTLPIMDESFDVRGNPAIGGIDARGINPQPATAGCPQCGTPLRASGPGRRPVYCSRSCSSKAYRKRRTEDHQDAVADALVSSRVETPDPAAAADAGAQELLELAAAVQRATAHYLHHLEQARRSQGADPRCNRALELLETSVTGATQRLLRQAHVLRYEMTSARLRTGPGAGLVSTRTETPHPGTNLVPTRVETPSSGSDAVPQAIPAPERTVSGAADVVPAPRPGISPRVETPAPAADLFRRASKPPTPSTTSRGSPPQADRCAPPRRCSRVQRTPVQHPTVQRRMPLPVRCPTARCAAQRPGRHRAERPARCSPGRSGCHTGATARPAGRSRVQQGKPCCTWHVCRVQQGGGAAPAAATATGGAVRPPVQVRQPGLSTRRVRHVPISAGQRGAIRDRTPPSRRDNMLRGGDNLPWSAPPTGTTCTARVAAPGTTCAAQRDNMRRSRPAAAR